MESAVKEFLLINQILEGRTKTGDFWGKIRKGSLTGN